MNPNHKPNWQEWTPAKGKEFWQQSFKNALDWHSECLLHDIPIMPIEDFLEAQQDLYCIEQILTHQDTKELWGQLSDFKIPPFLFLNEYSCALDGSRRINRTKEYNDYAILVEKQANQLIETLNNCVHYSQFVSDLDKILERSRYFQSMYENERQIVSNKTRKGLIDETYLRESLSNFFKKWTQQPRHNLVKIALNVTFDKKKSAEKIRKANSRSNKNK